MRHLTTFSRPTPLIALALLLGACTASTSVSSEANFTAYDSHLMSGTSTSDFEVDVSTEGLPSEARSLLTCFAQQGDRLWTEHFPCFEHVQALVERRLDALEAIDGFRRTVDGAELQQTWRGALHNLTDLCTRFYPETPDTAGALDHLSEVTAGFQFAPHDLPLRVFGYRCDARASFPQETDCHSRDVSLHPDRRLAEVLVGTLESSVKILPQGSNIKVQCHHQSSFREFGPSKQSMDGKSYVERVSRPAHATTAVRSIPYQVAPFIDVNITDIRSQEVRLSFAPLVSPPVASPRYGDQALTEFKVLYVDRHRDTFEQNRQAVIAQGYRVVADGVGIDAFPGRSSILTKELGNGKLIKVRMIEDDLHDGVSDAQAPVRHFAEEAQLILYNRSLAGFRKIGTLDGVYGGDPGRYRIDLVLTRRIKSDERVVDRSEVGTDKPGIVYSAGIRDHLGAATVTSGLSVVDKVAAGMMGVGPKVTYNQIAEEDHSFIFGKTASNP